ncbi:MAG: gliding motility-associated C-terminal domain-containing protein [Bacteroidota bacterium]|nr:gliding motility-associated C-terminal domain-containing protein [Bacteroidota bacterium]
MKSILFFLLFTSLSLRFCAQSNIGGIINNYTPVISLSCNTVTVTNASAFSIGDRVLIIQMKGAKVDSSNTATFGTILSLDDCGNYEFGNITSISGNIISLQFQLLNSYTPSGLVQLIRVPQYTDATVVSTLNPMAWNGSIGGVLVFEVSGKLTLNAPIDANGKGFRGGTQCANPDGGCGAGYSSYYYNISSGFGAEKGEGIAVLSANKSGGRGSIGNGGGGGNKHNSGGGGGGNYSTGGKGGDQANFCASSSVGGIGGNGLNYTANKMFMGGGGGSSDYNNGVGSFGTNGGGIIIIKADTLIGGNNVIASKGLDVNLINNGIGDGAGGAGAGGTILLHITEYITNLTVEANGGHGGDQNCTYPGCFGPGGGGGTGAICFSSASTPINVSTFTLSGLAGMDTYSGSPCFNSNFGAADGQSSNGVLYNLTLPESATIINDPIDLGNDTTLCLGPVTLDAFLAGATYMWSTGSTSSSIVVNTAGMYFVDVSVGGCIFHDTINIFSGPAVPTLLGNDTTLCIGPVALDAFIAGATYIWSTGSTNSSIVVNTAGIYFVDVSLGGCAFHDTINILGSPAAPNLLGNDTTLCLGPVTLDAFIAGATYMWSTGSTSSSIVVNSAGMYFVDVSTSGCTFRDTINILGNSGALSQLGNDTSLCGSSLTLDASFAGVSSYLWSTGETTPIISVNAAGTYWITTQLNGCNTSDTIHIFPPSVISLDLGNDTVVCSFPVTLNAANTTSSYLWSTNEVSPTISVNSSGSYWVTVSTNDCAYTDSDTISINLTSTGPLSTDNDTIICGDPITLSVNYPRATDYLWSTGEITPFINIADEGIYWVQVIQDNCVNIDSFEVKGSISGGELYVPNAFTPDSDHLNGVFYAEGESIITFSMKIFNRWGELIFESNKQAEGWDGTYKGKLVQSDTYVWIIDYVSDCNYQASQRKTGTVMVAR